ncbi:MAG: hypothetical protein HFG54_13040 [Lachnospiraceae bacterium]|jgi:hypothetical protein|nr:hypothetical protein [Lachnospiraceae bacterium]
MKTINSKIVNTPYDDVFRTLLNDCSRLIIPVINEVFDEFFSGDEKVVFSPEIHFMNQQDGEEVKRITDSSFTIVGKEEKKFLYECQSTADSSMLVRIFEYATQIALDQGEIIKNTLKVEIPRSAILFLRSTESTPDKMKIEMVTPGGTVSFEIPVMKAQRYGIEEIFEKNLLFLIPFYIFSHESRFEEYNSDKDKLEILKAEYADIMARLDQLLENGSISAYTRKIIMEMSDKVLENIAQKFEHVREGVKSVMGGKVLEHEAKTILREGWKQGREQGRREGEGYGRMEQAKETAFNLRTIGLEEETIAKMVNVQVSVIREWFTEGVS